MASTVGRATAAQREARMAPLFHGSCTSHESYGLTCEDYTALRRDHDDQCRLCGSRHPWMNIDHEHPLGMRAVRGLLCPRCNAGHMRRVDWGERAIDDRTRDYLMNPWYLRRHGKSTGYDPRVHVAFNDLCEVDQAEVRRLANPSGHCHYGVWKAEPRFEHLHIATCLTALDLRPVMRLIWMFKGRRFNTDIAAMVGPMPRWAEWR